MDGKNYEFIEHTADICIRVKGADLKALFINTALAMFDIIADKLPVKSPLDSARAEQATRPQTVKIEQEAENLDELFVNWLNELLSLSSAQEIILSDFKITDITTTYLKAEAIGYSSEDYKFNKEIKAATYHELKIEKSDGGWQAEVIFDV
ncbi:MAG: archease [Candidatus Omnitrophica bacterium]|nr:archease [Candidatus Omnitrophota bacterium]MBU1870054.1 archease [Candidatus Omnitrophota bacterium]